MHWLFDDIIWHIGYFGVVYHDPLLSMMSGDDDVIECKSAQVSASPNSTEIEGHFMLKTFMDINEPYETSSSMRLRAEGSIVLLSGELSVDVRLGFMSGPFMFMNLRNKGWENFSRFRVDLESRSFNFGRMVYYTLTRGDLVRKLSFALRYIPINLNYITHPMYCSGIPKFWMTDKRLGVATDSTLQCLYHNDNELIRAVSLAIRRDKMLTSDDQYKARTIMIEDLSHNATSYLYGRYSRTLVVSGKKINEDGSLCDGFFDGRPMFLSGHLLFLLIGYLNGLPIDPKNYFEGVVLNLNAVRTGKFTESIHNPFSESGRKITAQSKPVLFHSYVEYQSAIEVCIELAPRITQDDSLRYVEYLKLISDSLKKKYIEFGLLEQIGVESMVLLKTHLSMAKQTL
jgi:hypothetical protein